MCFSEKHQCAVGVMVSLTLRSISQPCEGPAWSWVAAGCLHQHGCHGRLHTCCMMGSQSPRLSLRLSWAASGHVFPWGVWSQPSLTWPETCYTASHGSTQQITQQHYLAHMGCITSLGRPKSWIPITSSVQRLVVLLNILRQSNFIKQICLILSSKLPSVWYHIICCC